MDVERKSGNTMLSAQLDDDNDGILIQWEILNTIFFLWK